MTDLTSTLASVSDALRLMTLALVVAVLVAWSPSWWRTLKGKARSGDAGRATGVMLAVALLIFETRALWPGFSVLDRQILGVAAHVMMLATILAKIYIHGRNEVETFRPRRAALVHAMMLLLCILTVIILR